jgi:hypothetical protein
VAVVAAVAAATVAGVVTTAVANTGAVVVPVAGNDGGTGSGGGAGSSGAAYRSDTQIVTDRIKILYGWLQIFTALTFTFDIKWPIQLKSFSLGMNFINLDLSKIMAGSACSLSLPFLDMMVVHAAVPLMLLVTIFMARLPAYFLRKKHRKKQSAVQIKLCFSLALILYPGACWRSNKLIFFCFFCSDSSSHTPTPLLFS